MVHATSRAVLIALCTLFAVQGAAAISCTANQYVSSNTCTDCATGYARASGDDSTGADTACLLCAADYYVSVKGAVGGATAGTCAQCTAGYTNPLGSDATSTGTAFTAANKGCLKCAANYYLSTKGGDATTAGTCSGCTAKSYIVAGTDATSTGTVNRCLDRTCAADQYVKQGVCTDCPAGFTRPSGDDSTGAETQCVACADGYFVATLGADTSSPGTCTQCPTGHTTASATSVSSGALFADATVGCLKCAVGYRVHARHGSSATTAGTCTACDAGTTAPSLISHSGGASLATQALGCYWCADGYRVSALHGSSAVTAGTCVACAAGTSTASAVSGSGGSAKTTQALGCLQCAADYYVSAKHASSATTAGTCTACATGFSNAVGDNSASGGTDVTGCYEAAANYYVSALGADATTAGTASACATGSTNKAGDSSISTGLITQCDVKATAFPETCLVNQYVKDNRCVDCASGLARAAGDDPSGSDTKCLSCAVGFYLSTKGVDATTAGTCTTCGATLTTASADATTTGTAFTAANKGCLKCKAGYRLSVIGATGGATAGTCVGCPAKFFTASADATSAGTVVAACLSCAADHFVATKSTSATTAGTCTACTSGTAKKGAASVNAAGDLSTSAGAVTTCDAAVCANSAFNSAIAGCTLCAENYSVATIGASLITPGTCTSCAAGKTNAKDDVSSSAGAVTTCDKTLCAVNNYVKSNACVGCAAGTVVAKDGDASGADTTCTSTKCAVNQYVKSNVCTACATGTTIAKDGDASGADTACGASCAVNQYVKSKVCTACAAGTTNAVGDSVSGADTSCAKTTCAINEYVKSNVCTACIVGTTNVVGDDASGADTTCDASPVSSASRSDISFATIFVVIATLLACAAL